MFIIFPGLGSTEKHFKLNDVQGTFLNNSNFLPQLRKLGKVHVVDCNWHNLSYYDVDDKEEQHLYKDQIDFTKSELHIPSICEATYHRLRDFKGKFVLIAHSIGSFASYYFSQQYSSRCAASFLIDASAWGKFDINPREHRRLIDGCKGVTNKQIQRLIQQTKTFDKRAFNKLRDIVAGLLERQMPRSAKTLKVKTVSFRNLQLKTTPGGSKMSEHEVDVLLNMEAYFYNNNPTKYLTVWLLNKTHSPHWQKESRDHILETIRCQLALIQKRVDVRQGSCLKKRR